MKVIKEVSKSDLRDFMYNRFQDCADDKELYKCLNEGKAVNVFQMSAGTASQVVNQIHPDNLAEMTACNAFARPGTIDGVPNYISGKNGNLKYKNPIIISVFGETFGVCLYQESVMKIVELLSPKKENSNEPVYSGNYARGLLKKLGKSNKKQEDIDSWKDMVKDIEINSKQIGVSPNEVKELISDMEVLANYSFNKSHALAYSMMAAWTLYMNVYFKKYYYPAVIEYAFAHDKETLETLKSMRKNGFTIHAPDLNTSKARTFSSGNDIYVGLHNLKQVGAAADSICTSSPYNNFSDFLRKNLEDSKVNKRVYTAIVEYGCFDKLEPTITRHQMLSCFSNFWENKPAFKKLTADEAERIKTDSELREKLVSALKKKIDGIVEFWENIKKVAESNEFATKDTRQFRKDCEAKYLGFNFFISPFEGEISNFIEERIRTGKCVSDFSEVRKYKDISKIVPVYISSVREYKDKNGNLMAFLTLEDRAGEEVVVPIFASVYPYVSEKIAPDVIAFALLYNSDDTYHGGQQIMFGTKKRVSPEKNSSFIIPLRRVDG